jgi:RHS repeat-associated protein
MAHLDVALSLSSSVAPNHQRSAALWRTVLTLLLLHILLGTGWAQTDPFAGIIPLSTQAPGVFESVDLASGNIYTQIPVRNKIGKLPFSYALTGNSDFYVIPGCTGLVGSCGPTTRWGIGGGGGALGLAAGVGYTTTTFQASCSGYPSTTAWEYTNFYITDSTGAIHSLGMSPLYANVATSCGYATSGTAVASDGSGYTLVATTYTYSGWITEPIFTIYDRSGNAYPTVTDPMNQLPANYTVVQDPDGATITAVPTYSNNNFLYTTYTDTLDTTALTYEAGGALNYLDAANNTQQFEGSTSENTQIQTNFGCPGIAEYPYGGVAVHAANPYILTTPTGNITFTYEITPGDTHSPHYVTGRLASITYPSGASVSYTYAGGNNNTGIYCPPSNTVVPTLTKTVTDVNGNQSTWTYVNSNTGTVTVTDPASNQTVYTFVGEFQTQALYYQGSASGGTLLKTVVTCYNGNNASRQACIDGPNPGATGNPPTEKDVYTYLGSSTTPSLVVTKFDYYGSVTSVSNYGFGATYPPSGSTPVSTTTTVYDYPATTGGAYPCGTLMIAYMFDRPCSVTTTNSAGATVSQTNYTYNATGHPITTSRWVSSSASPLVSSATYATNGVLTSVTDVNNAVTKYSNGPGVGACNGILPTATTYPQIGTVQMSTSQTWNCNGAVVTSSTDANSQKTTTSYVNSSNVADPYYRPLSTTDPLGNITNYTYTTTTFESAMNFNGTSSTTDTLITTDGLGRQIFSQTRQSQGSTKFDTVQTTYGWTTTSPTVAGGPVTTTSVPYTGTAAQTAPSGTGVTTTQDDAIQRPISVTDTFGGSTTYQYIKQDTVATVSAPSGENPKVHQYEYNGLGWLTSVCEVTAGSTSYPGKSCSPQLNTETGYLTEYSYNALGMLQTATQSANGAYAQGRSYTYDGLSRLTQESNPESGTVSYTYDSITSGNCKGSYPGDLVMKVDNIGNAICGQYDGLHRITSYTYPAGPYSSVTPAKTFVYDTTAESCSVSPGYVIGRLADAYTGTSSAKTVDTQYCYSPRGQTTDVFQSTPNSAGYAHLIITYWANGQTETISGISGLSNLRYGVDGEGRINGFDPTALTPDPVKTVSYNPASQITNVNFNSGETDAYSYDVMNRMNKYTYTLGSSSLVGTPTWNPNGTLGSLNISDEFNSANNQDCTYTHDDLARISNVSCTESGWSQAFTYDQFGNIKKTGSSSWIPSYYNSNGSTYNQYVGGGTSYDANGNLTSVTYGTQTTPYIWDADGNIATVNGTITNTYDAFDRLVEASAGPTQFLYLPGGTQPFTTMSNYKTYLKAFAPAPGGAMILTPNGEEGAISYHRHTDWLGSSRFATTPSETVYSDGAYAPFGEPYAPSGTTDLVFGGNAQDASAVEGATAGDAYDTLNRKYSAVQGRWISPDPAGLGAVDPSNPQSWNRYAYALNNPLRYVDPSGLILCDYGPSDNGGEDFEDADDADECTSNGGTLPSDQTTVTVNGDNPDDVGPTTENGEQIFPQIVQAANNGNCGTTWIPRSFGVSYGGNADAGAGYEGISATGSAGAGVFYNGNTGASTGAFAGGGATAYFFNGNVGTPTQQGQPFNFGGYAGVGPSAWISNAGGAPQLGGPFTTWSLNVGAGLVKG